jgi:hypothetical protein
LSATFRFPRNVMLIPQMQYQYTKSQVISARCELGKYFSSNGFASVFAEKNYKSDFESFGVTLRFDLSFAQLNFSARRVGNITTLVEAARGSLLYDSETKYFGASNRTSVGKGGITIVAFLDLNGNGLREPNEPKAGGVRAQISGGRLQYHRSDTSIIVTDLEAYASYILKLSTDGVENIAWQISKKVWRVGVSPNQLRLLEVPVSVINEVSGMVMTDAPKGRKGLGGITVLFYNVEGKLMGKVLTEADGFFSFPGLMPGTYSARIDAGQLNKLNYNVFPKDTQFVIQTGREGATVEGLQFIVNPVTGKE